MVFCEVLYGDARLEDRGFFKDGLCVAYFQSTLEGGEMKHFGVAYKV